LEISRIVPQITFGNLLHSLYVQELKVIWGAMTLNILTFSI
jgi:hypothetical protein